MDDWDIDNNLLFRLNDIEARLHGFESEKVSWINLYELGEEFKYMNRVLHDRMRGMAAVHEDICDKYNELTALLKNKGESLMQFSFNVATDANTNLMTFNLNAHNPFDKSAPPSTFSTVVDANAGEGVLGTVIETAMNNLLKMALLHVSL